MEIRNEWPFDSDVVDEATDSFVDWDGGETSSFVGWDDGDVDNEEAERVEEEREEGGEEEEGEGELVDEVGDEVFVIGTAEVAETERKCSISGTTTRFNKIKRLKYVWSFYKNVPEAAEGVTLLRDGWEVDGPELGAELGVSEVFPRNVSPFFSSQQRTQGSISHPWERLCWNPKKDVEKKKKICERITAKPRRASNWKTCFSRPKPSS